MYLRNLPIRSLRLVQRTLSTGLQAVHWRNTQQTNNLSLTHVSSLHFLIHFVHPRAPYRRIHVEDLLTLCGFDSSVNLSDALRALRANIGKFKECAVPGSISDVGEAPLVLPNEAQSLRHVPLHFWQLCQGVLLSDAAAQQPTSLHQRNLLMEPQ